MFGLLLLKDQSWNYWEKYMLSDITALNFTAIDQIVILLLCKILSISDAGLRMK